MKKMYNILTILSVLIALFTIQASAEIRLYQETYKDDVTDTVNFHAFYSLDDTSIFNYQNELFQVPNAVDKWFNRFVKTPILIYYEVEELPYNITQRYPQYINAYVDWCNLTIRHDKNEYDIISANVINVTTEITNLYFTSSPFSFDRLQFDLKDKDNLIVDLKCHYTNSQTLFIDNVLIGRFTTYFSAYECAECSSKTLEEISTETQALEQGKNAELFAITNIQGLINYNSTGWTLLDWTIRILMLLLALVIMFGFMYYLYKIIKDVNK